MPTIRGRSKTDFSSLQAIERVRSLTLINTNICGEAVRPLSTAVRLRELEVSSSVIGDELLTACHGLPELVSLFIREAPLITGSGLHALNGGGLHELYLEQTGLQDRFLGDLTNMEHLWSLSVQGTPLGDEGLAHLSRLPKLSLLLASNTNITGKGFSHWPELHTLEDLYLECCPVEDQDVACIARACPRLRRLALSGTRITDAAAESLQRLTRLESLRINRTRVTDATFEMLRDCRSLQSVAFQSTAISQDAVDRLQRANRKVSLYRSE